MDRLLAIGLCVFFLNGCVDRNNAVLLSNPPLSASNRDSFWSTVPAESTPLSRDALIDHVRLCEKTGADSQIVIYGDKIVSEWYGERYAEPVGAMSSTKVVASLLVGTLADAGKLSYQTRVSSILPEWTSGFRDEVTVRDVLTHTAGFERRMGKDDSVGYAEKKSEFVLGIFPDFKPGSKFEYSNEGVQLLEPVIRQASGMPTAEYAQKILFDRIGMGDTSLYAYGGSPWLYAEMRTTPRDLARLGLLMKRGGVWGEDRIVSGDYVTQATRPSPQFPGMGFLWWILDESKTVRGFYASGYLNTDIYVFSDYDVVIVRTQAPKNGFTGKSESGYYFEKAMPLFKRMVNEK